MDFEKGKIVLALEGGYNLGFTSNSVLECMEVLLESKQVTRSSKAYPFELVILQKVTLLSSIYFSIKKTFEDEFLTGPADKNDTQMVSVSDSIKDKLRMLHLTILPTILPLLLRLIFAKSNHLKPNTIVVLVPLPRLLKIALMRSNAFIIHLSLLKSCHLYPNYPWNQQLIKAGHFFRVCISENIPTPGKSSHRRHGDYCPTDSPERVNRNNL
ncbi:hypothetical protein WN944_014568 [Citrus x changshan-huyou]|uniref:Histone deacetylase n=1 Tax=Citrus x changshan-huyou TaxID=2935761 RepID=A0AAP0M838_9ROSI